MTIELLFKVVQTQLLRTSLGDVVQMTLTRYAEDTEVVDPYREKALAQLDAIPQGAMPEEAREFIRSIIKGPDGAVLVQGFPADGAMTVPLQDMGEIKVGCVLKFTGEVVAPSEPAKSRLSAGGGKEKR